MKHHYLWWLLLVPAWAFAQDGVHHCIDADGNPLFADQPCEFVQARPVVIPPPAPPPTPDNDDASTSLCAASLPPLLKRVRDAFASHDANRLAGLMLWDGQSSTAVSNAIRDIGELMRQPSLGIDSRFEPSSINIHPDDIYNPSVPPPDSGQPVIVVHGSNDDRSGDVVFPVTRHAGCLWIKPPAT